MPGQMFACAHCGTEKVLVEKDLDPEHKWEAHPETGAYSIWAGCGLCETQRRHYAVGRSVGSIRALNRRLRREAEEAADRARADGGDSEGEGGAEDSGEDEELAHLIAEIEGSGEERVRDMVEWELRREDPRQEIVGAGYRRLSEIGADTTFSVPADESNTSDEVDSDTETETEPDPSHEPEPAPELEPEAEEDETETDASESADRTSDCPGCETEVSVSTVFRIEECPECGRPLSEILGGSESSSDSSTGTETADETAIPDELQKL